MSADNGVYILVTKGTEEGKLEYRVAHTQNIENLNYVPTGEDWENDHRPTEEAYDENYLEPEFALDVFGDSTVFTDQRQARSTAERIHDEWMSTVGVVEYGIVVLDHTDVYFPQEVAVG